MKNGKAYVIPQDTEENRKKDAARKSIAKAGHEPHFREKPAPDRIEELPVDTCPDCGNCRLGRPSVRARNLEGITHTIHFDLEYLMCRLSAAPSLGAAV